MGSGSEGIAILRPKIGKKCRMLNDLNNHTRNLYLLFAFVTILFISVNTAEALDLTISAPYYANLGDTVTYAYTLTNSNGFDLFNINIIDNQFGTIPFGDLSDGETRTIFYPHVINDSNMPVLDNGAYGVGEDINGRQVTSQPVSHTIYLGFSGSLKVSKKPSDPPAGYTGYPIGHTITYTFEVENTNAFSVHDLTVSDDIYHPSKITRSVTLDKTTLAPNEKATGTATYTVVQEDIEGPPSGIIGHPRAVITDIASAIAYPSWISVGGQTVSGVASMTVGIGYSSTNGVDKTTHWSSVRDI